MTPVKIYGFLLLIFSLAGGCVEPYDAPVDDRDVNFLVIDGFLDASKGAGSVTLSRTLPVESPDPIPAESNAMVQIEDDRGNFYPLTETSNGVYTGAVSDANTKTRYRLIIATSDKRQYASGFVTLMETPPIDSIHYSASSDGVEFSVNTHDPSNEARYYRWKYRETYEYHSNFNSVYMFQGDEIVFRPLNMSFNTCWRTNRSTDILIGTTKHLKESIVSNFPVSFIPKGSMKLSVKYSLLVEQQAITEEAYTYWSNLEKSTEHLGGLFDPLPSEVSGNIHSVSHPDETVIGFFGGGTVQEKRMFLNRRDLPKEVIRFFTNADPGCELDTIRVADLPNISTSTWLVDAIFAPGAGIVAYTFSTQRCIDCTRQGGTTEKPDFWE